MYIRVSARTTLRDGSTVEWSITRIKADKWRHHGIKYRIAWIQKGECRVLFDNHHGKYDHCHIDDTERAYQFITVEQLWMDFRSAVHKLGGST